MGKSERAGTGETVKAAKDSLTGTWTRHDGKTGKVSWTLAPQLLEVVEGPVEFVDTRNNKRQGKVHVKPSGVVTAGVPYGRPYQAPFTVR